MLFLLLELNGDEVHVQDFLFPLVCVCAEVSIVCYGLRKSSGNTVQDGIDNMLVDYLDLHIESIDIVYLFLDCTCLSKHTNLVKSPV